MENPDVSGIKKIIPKIVNFIRMSIFHVLSVGTIPTHIAFIMDGNRRYALKKKLEEGVGHKAGLLALLSMLRYCYELGVKYVTVYAFSIDNFKRRPSEVQYVMDLLEEKALELLDRTHNLNQYGVRVRFVGNLKLLKESTRLAIEKAMEATAMNDKVVLSICVAYTSTDEIVHAIQEACKKKQSNSQLSSDETIEEHGKGVDQVETAIKLIDIERHMYLAEVPNPDVLIRTSGETRLSNFLLWQTTYSYLHSPSVLWPGINLWTVVWVILNFQRAKYYLDKKKKLT